MNNNFRFYFSKGWRLANFVFKQTSFKTKVALFVYFLISLVGKLFLFTAPIFAVSDSNLGKMLDEIHDFSLSKVFYGAFNGKKYLNLLGGFLIKHLVVGLIFFLCYIPHLMNMYWFEARTYNEMMSKIFYYGGPILASLISIPVLLGYGPLGYIGANSNDLDVSDFLFLSHASMKKNKFKLFMTYFVELLIEGVVVGGLFVLGVYLMTKNDMFYMQLAGLGVYLVLLAICVFFLNVVALAGVSSRYELFNDIVKIKKSIVIKPIASDSEEYTVLFSDQADDLNAITTSQLKEKEK